MVLSPSSLALTLVEDAPEKVLEERVRGEGDNIRRELAKGESYTLKDDQGNVFIIQPKPTRGKH